MTRRHASRSPRSASSSPLVSSPCRSSAPDSSSTTRRTTSRRCSQVLQTRRAVHAACCNRRSGCRSTWPRAITCTQSDWPLHDLGGGLLYAQPILNALNAGDPSGARLPPGRRSARHARRHPRPDARRPAAPAADRLRHHRTGGQRRRAGGRSGRRRARRRATHPARPSSDDGAAMPSPRSTTSTRRRRCSNKINAALRPRAAHRRTDEPVPR